MYFRLYCQLLKYLTYKPCRIATNIVHLLLLSHISLCVSLPPPFHLRHSCSISWHSPAAIWGLSVALHVILSISICRPRSHSAIPLAPSDLGRSRPANWLRVIDALAEYRTSPEPIIYCSALYNVIIAGSYSTLAFSPFSLVLPLRLSSVPRAPVKRTSRLIDSRSLEPISRPLPRLWRCTFRWSVYRADLMTPVITDKGTPKL